MSRRRKMTPSWGTGKQPKGPNGRGLCFWCGTEVPKRRRNWCSDDCFSQFRRRTEPQLQAHLLRDRDAGVCAICGINADIALAEYREKRAAFQKKQNADMQWDKDEHGKITGAMRYGYRAQPDIDALKKEYKERGWPVNDAVHCYRWWDVDHILPVSEGGGPDDYPRDKDYLENLRTLCVPCHKKETRALRARLKEKKNEQKQLQKEKS